MPILFAASFLLGAGLLGLALRTATHRRWAPSLPAAVPSPSPSDSEVTVLLPVRDEEANVAECVGTLLAQTAHPRVLVIDDGSTDATAALVTKLAASEPRLALTAAGPLPPGWRGKVHALAVGAAGLDTPWILSTDADTRHQPGLLARARDAAGAWRLDGISIAGTQEAHGLGENLLVPTVFALLDTLLGDWRPAGRGEGPAVANGQFILLRREAWESCGGFETVAAETIDDVAVVARMRDRGYRTAFVRAPDLLSVRMYRGWAETFRGWRRNLGGIFGAQPALVAAILTALLGPPALLAADLLAGRWAAAALLWGAGALASALLRSGSGNHPAYGLLYPLDALALAWTLAIGTLDRRRGKLVSWKGREIKV